MTLEGDYRQSMHVWFSNETFYMSSSPFIFFNLSKFSVDKYISYTHETSLYILVKHCIPWKEAGL